MMKLTQVKGNTWVIEAMALIPFYKLDSRRVILLDTGLREEGEAIEQTLLKNGLEPVGILCSHVHVDHCGNNRYFQEKYGIPVALTPSEAGMCRSVTTLKSYFLVLSPQTVEREAGWLVHTPDVLLPEREGDFAFAGATFHIVPTPGTPRAHLPGHGGQRVLHRGRHGQPGADGGKLPITSTMPRPTRAGSGCAAYTATNTSWPTGTCVTGGSFCPSSTTTGR